MNTPESATPKRLRAANVRFCCHKIWPDHPSTAEEMASEALLILTTAYERRPCFFSGKSEKGILSGLLYYLGQKHKNIKTQHSIARSLTTTEMTVRASYRDWMEQFPDLLS